MKILIPKFNITVTDPITGETTKILKKKIYILSDIMFYPFIKYAEDKKIKINKILKYYDVNQYFKNLNCNEIENVGRVIIIRTGGIGDLIALSSIAKYILDRGIKHVSFVTQNKYMDLFYFFPKDINGKHFFQPIIDEVEKQTNNIRVIFFEGIIETSKENWYEIQFNRIGADFTEEYGRPNLEKNIKIDRVLSDGCKNILINLKASSPVRTAMITKEFIDIVIDNVEKRYHNYKILFLKRNLNKYEINLLEKINNNKIMQIETKSLLDFLKVAYQADFSISVDTSLIHFVEGIGKPGLGIYSSFPTYARTKYYKYTKCVDITSPCPYQPCFIHTKKPGETCKITIEKYKEGVFKDEDLLIAPCLNKKFNPTYYEQLNKAMEDIQW